MFENNPRIARLINFVSGYILLSVIATYWVVARQRLHVNHPFHHLLNATTAILLFITALFHRSYKIAYLALFWAFLATYFYVRGKGIIAAFFS